MRIQISRNESALEKCEAPGSDGMSIGAGADPPFQDFNLWGTIWQYLLTFLSMNTFASLISFLGIYPLPVPQSSPLLWLRGSSQAQLPLSSAQISTAQFELKIHLII
jgi:hypothetical protein